jgi:transposase InsO family protein
MRVLSLSGLQPKRVRRTTIRVPGVRVASDLVERDFRPSHPDELWCADIKYVRTWQGWFYLAAVMDCYSRSATGVRS